MIMFLVPVRQYILPRFFKSAHLQDLDAAEYEEAPAVPFNIAVAVNDSITNSNQTPFFFGFLDLLLTNFSFLQEAEMGSTASYPCDSEILDEFITRSRGEFRHTCSPKVTSSTSTPVYNRQLSQVFSPRVNELRSEMSPRVAGKGQNSPQPSPLNPSSSSPS